MLSEKHDHLEWFAYMWLFINYTVLVIDKIDRRVALLKIQQMQAKV